MRNREEEWKVLLEEFRPPHPPGSLATEEMWRLISAASENPTLRSLYPATSMWSLTFSDADLIEDIKDSLPAISAANGEYRVLSWPHTEDVSLFLTSDPTEAVTFTAEWIVNQKTDQPGPS
ncbi:DUF6193 family natural product biosynthesis protein [Streptomyces sp. NPDC047079]|uniref:DUF6193 family natural product biosynthesis protein n=1 Tax=Streptomyces sp. NPDC047079 TaxID=3154607 RepID=UPI0034092003